MVVVLKWGGAVGPGRSTNTSLGLQGWMAPLERGGSNIGTQTGVGVCGGGGGQGGVYESNLLTVFSSCPDK